MIHTYLDLIVNVRLQVLQIAVHIVEIIRHTLRRRDKSTLIGLAAGILRNLLQRQTELIKDGFESRLAIVLQIFLDHLAVVCFRVKLAQLRLVIPELIIIKLVADTLDRQCVNTRACTAVSRKHAKRIHCLLLHFLSAVPFRMGIADIVRCRVKRRIRSP